jgi:hypothetical protein
MNGSTPSIVPTDDQTVYLVLDDFVDVGRCWRETVVEKTDLETVISDLLEGQYYKPVRVIGFNVAEGWSRDASEQVAGELRRHCERQGANVPAYLESFVQLHEGHDRPAFLRG